MNLKKETINRRRSTGSADQMDSVDVHVLNTGSVISRPSSKLLYKSLIYYALLYK